MGFEDVDDRGGHKKSERQMDRTRDNERVRRRRSGRDDRDESEHRMREAEENNRTKDWHSRRDSDDDDGCKRLGWQRDRTVGDAEKNSKKTNGNGKYRSEMMDARAWGGKGIGLLAMSIKIGRKQMGMEDIEEMRRRMSIEERKNSREKERDGNVNEIWNLKNSQHHRKET